MKPDDDLPEITDDMPARAELRVDGKLIRRGGTNKVARIVFALMTKGGRYDDQPIAA